MPSRIDIGPDTGPFVELDEENGEFVIRVPEDEVNFDQSDLRNVKDFTAGSVSTEEASIGQNYGLATTDLDFDISNQSTFTQVPIDSSLTDLASAWDFANDRFVAPADGQYLFSWHCYLNPSEPVSGRLLLSINIPAFRNKRSDDRNVEIDSQKVYSVIGGSQLSAGDVVQFRVFQELEDNLTIDSDTTNNRFEYWRLG